MLHMRIHELHTVYSNQIYLFNLIYRSYHICQSGQPRNAKEAVLIPMRK